MAIVHISRSALRIVPNDIDEAVNSILGRLAVKRFPRDFLPEGTRGEILRIPRASEISMYRELEGIYLLLDGNRIFFNNPVLAKYAFYAAKQGETEILVPGTDEAKKLLKEFREYTHQIRIRIQTEADSMNFPEDNSAEIVSACLSELGIDDLDL